MFQAIGEWFHRYLIENEVGNAILRVLLLVVPILMIVPLLIWWERRLLSWMQDRIGPNRVGNITFSKTSRMVPGFLKGKKFKLFGLIQPLADGVKLFFKEDITPASVDKLIYFIAPALALFPAFALGGVMPWGPYPSLTPVADVNIGVLYLLAISSLGVYGVVLAGYASNNKYSLMGGLRSSAQLISYELAMGMSLACIVLATGSLKMTEMIGLQQAPWLSGPGMVDGVVQQVGGVPYIQNWLIMTPFGLIAGLIFLVCMVAETNRAPFDLPEAENELIAGYHTEYSSMKFAVFFMGEYAAMLVFSGIFTTVFLGGWSPLPIRWEAIGLPQVNDWIYPVAWMFFIGKMMTVFSVYIWLRATLPRLRYDQLMNLGWRSLLPLAVTNFIIVGMWLLVSRLYGWQAGLASMLAAFGAIVAAYLAFRRIITKGQPSFEHRQIELVNQPARRVELVEGG
ncbi:MAG: complex I subunit 1 family protein [Fimbriimonadaceae bacterium]